jgi:TolB-like protein/DNA-binding SARP family transcriptional activator
VVTGWSVLRERPELSAVAAHQNLAAARIPEVHTEHSSTHSAGRVIMVIRVETLGGLRLLAGSRELCALRQQRALSALLVYLAVEGRASRDSVVATFWPESDAENARHSLRQSLYRLRSAIGSSDWLVVQGDELLLGPEAECDVAEFEAALGSADPAAAARLYQGEFLRSVHLADVQPWQQWAELHRLRLALSYRQHCRAWVDACLHGSDLAGAFVAARAWATPDPKDEEAQHRLVELLAETGDRKGAIAQFEAYAGLLEVHGLAPAEETAALYHSLRQASAAAGLNPATMPNRPAQARSSAAALAVEAGQHQDPPLNGGLRGGRRAWPRTAQFAAGALAILVATVAVQSRRVSAPAEPATFSSLAVLPLQNLGGVAEQEHFVDGLTEALITELGSLTGLRVISRTSAMQYRNTTKSLPEIARELNVDALVEGAVARAGGRVRVSVTLLDASADRALWSAAFEDELGDVLRLQAHVAQSVADAVGSRLQLAGVPPPRRYGQVDTLAFEAYLKGRHHWRQRTRSGLERALFHFREALDHDPFFPPAYAGLADTYNMMSGYGFRPPSEMAPLAKAAAQRAIELDGSLAEAHAALGHIAGHYDYDLQAAERASRRSIDLNPSYATAHHWYSLLLVRLGRADDAIAAAVRARDLDPLAPPITGNVPRVRYFTGEFAEAARGYAAADRNVSIQRWPRVGMAMSYLAMGQHDAALGALEVPLDSWGGLTECVRGLIYQAMQRTAEAGQILLELEQRAAFEYIDPTHIALLRGAVGDLDEAFVWLERAYRERSILIAYMGVDPLFDSMRGDPRFAAMLTRLGL